MGGGVPGGFCFLFVLFLFIFLYLFVFTPFYAVMVFLFLFIPFYPHYANSTTVRYVPSVTRISDSHMILRLTITAVCGPKFSAPSPRERSCLQQFRSSHGCLSSDECYSRGGTIVGDMTSPPSPLSRKQLYFYLGSEVSLQGICSPPYVPNTLGL